MASNTLEALAGGNPTVSKSDTASTSSAPIKRSVLSEQDIAIIPYNASRHDDAQNFLPWLWQKLKDDNLVELYFPGETKTGFADFVKLMSGSSVRILLVVLKDASGEPEKAIGFASSGPVPLGAANAGIGGFIFLKEFWDTKTTHAAAKAIMSHWFKEDGYDLMLGCVAELNHAANRFLGSLGWTKTGTVPRLGLHYNKECAAVLWHITKEAFHGQG